MNILIKMEMPQNCGECPCYYDGYCHGMQYREEDEDYRAVSYREYDKKRRDDCPLIEVPKHGRLIEDTVLDTMSMWNTDREYDRGWDSAVQAAKNRIKTAPTIIEAEGE